MIRSNRFLELFATVLLDYTVSYNQNLLLITTLRR